MIKEGKVSSAKALAGVTALLKYLLENKGIPDGVEVYSKLPAKVVNGEDNHINLFLYMATESAAYRNAHLPLRSGRGERVSEGVLALDLHFTLSVYAKEELKSEVLLGYAMQVFHEHPIVTKSMIREVLDGEQIVREAELIDQIEEVRITPKTLTIDDLSKLWNTFQAPYRQSAAYTAAVVLIEAEEETVAPLPVLQRKLEVQLGSTLPSPVLTSLEAQKNQLSVRLGEPLTLRGFHLEGSSIFVRFHHPCIRSPLEVVAESLSDQELKVHIPNLPDQWPAGIYQVCAVIESSDGLFYTTNTLPLSLAPEIEIKEDQVSRSGDTVTFQDVKCTPHIFEGQKPVLLVNGQEILPDPYSSPASQLTFASNKVQQGLQAYALRVDGVLFILRDQALLQVEVP